MLTIPLVRRQLMKRYLSRLANEMGELPVRFKPAIVEEDEADEIDLDGDEGGDPDPRLVISRRLLALGKSSYKHVSEMPNWFMDKRAQISAHRSPAQIRRCLRDWMIRVDRETNARYRDKAIGWVPGPMNPEKTADVYAYGAEETIAYAHYFMRPRFSIIRKVFAGVKTVLPNFSPSRVVDFGCGPGTAGAAAFDVWGNQMGKYAGVDMSRSMLEAAKIMFENLGDVDAVFWEKTADLARRAKERGERYDLAVASYTLSELTHDNIRRAATQILYELLDEGGVLVIVEQGNPVGSHIVRSARQFILDTFNEGAAALREAQQVKRAPGVSKPSTPRRNESVDASVQLVLPPPRNLRYSDLRAAVLAPCPHDAPCPLGKGVFCSFSQKVLSGVIHTDSEEKYSYVVIQKVRRQSTSRPLPSTDRSEKPQDAWLKDSLKVDNNSNPTPLEVLSRVMACKRERIPKLVETLIDEVDWEEYNPPLFRSEWSRIIR